VRVQDGEVWVAGPKLMSGYWRKPQASAEALQDGWYRTGDTGHLDANGALTVTGRRKDMIITGGENVYSMEVENVLGAHPAVHEAAVFGVPDERWGEAVRAVVVLRAGASASEAELIDWCRSRIGGYKVPKSVVLAREALPKSGPGKIAKHVVRKMYSS
jgi:long-chain acyl-CoA synthetase